jgi:hypothetical protein
MIALPAHPAAAEVAHHEEHDQDDHDDDDDIFDTHGCHLRREYYAARRGWLPARRIMTTVGRST